MYEVVSPLGQPVPKPMATTPSLDTLQGKRVCEISNRSFEWDTTFPIIRELLKQRYPGLEVIPYSEMPIVDTPSLTPDKRGATLAGVIDAIKENACDAVIAGNGG